MRIFDAHIHFCKNEEQYEGTVNELLKYADNNNVIKMGIIGWENENYLVEKAINEYPNKFIGYAWVNLDEDNPEIIEKYYKKGFHALKVILTEKNYDDTLYYPFYKKAEELKPLYHLYFEIFHNPNLYPRNKFLSLTQALEAYFRIEHDEKYISDDEYHEGYYKQLCKNIPENLPNDFKSHLKKGTFYYANEFSLRKKLKTILDEHESIFSNIPGDIKSEIDTLVNTRNYLIHHDESITDCDTSRIPEFSKILKLIIETILLRQIEIPKKQIIRSLS